MVALSEVALTRHRGNPPLVPTETPPDGRAIFASNEQHAGFSGIHPDANGPDGIGDRERQQHPGHLVLVVQLCDLLCPQIQNETRDGSW